MPFYNPEARRLTRSGNIIALVAATGGLLATSACAAEGVGGQPSSQEPSASASKSPSERGDTSGTNDGEATVPPRNSNLSWPGKVALTNECPTWSTDNHGPFSAKGKDVLIVADARNSYASQCDPVLDDGAGAQRGPSTEAGAVTMPQGDPYKGNFFKDGTVLRVTGFAEGQQACQPTINNSSTSLWMEVQAKPGDPKAWVSGPNAGFPSEQMLIDAQIPDLTQQHPQYSGTIQNGC